MAYTISELAELAGISTRTLRYYDQIELLQPARVNTNGYRIYGQPEIDLLQQILFYRELDLPLAEIKSILQAADFDLQGALASHLVQLQRQKKRLEGLIETVEKSLAAQEGELEMTETEKFTAFKDDMLAKNEEQYGEEIREKYGAEVIENANRKLQDVTPETWADHEELTAALNEKLAAATHAGDPASELGQIAAGLHKEWLIMAWPEGLYDTDKHYNLSEMYVEDPRFKAYYEKIAPGAAEFLRSALKVYLGK